MYVYQSSPAGIALIIALVVVSVSPSGSCCVASHVNTCNTHLKLGTGDPFGAPDPACDRKNLSSMASMLFNEFETSRNSHSSCVPNTHVVSVQVISYCTNWQQRWQFRKIPGPTPKFPLGNLVEIQKKQVHRAYADWARLYGDTFKVFVVRQPIVVTTGQRRHFSTRFCRVTACFCRY